MIGVKMNTFNDNSGEPEQDANSALTELDKGLRSGKVGEQCEAIVRFPRLFEKYPFPILINSSFLKLSDVFRMGNNFLRLWVLRVCQQSEKHLDKILNVDEFLRRVFSVLHSNDPVARALALRTLGAVAGIIPERQNVHHAIRRGLDSHDNVEVDAAIYATTRFAAHSNAFAVSMCNKLSDMVECESTAADRRVKLVRALRTVHGGAIRAHGVLNLLKSLLEKYPSSSLVRAAIMALTHIAVDTVVHVPDQVEVLLRIATEDGRAVVRRTAWPERCIHAHMQAISDRTSIVEVLLRIATEDGRAVVRRTALRGLRALARHAALWPERCIHALVQAPRHAVLSLQVMQTLVECPAVCAAAGCPPRGQTSALMTYCSEAALGTDIEQGATAARVLTNIVVHCYTECLPVDGSDLMIALESLVVATGEDDNPKNIRPLRIALQCLVKLCNAEPAVYTTRTCRLLHTQVNDVSWRHNTPRGAALLEALCALLPANTALALAHNMIREDCIQNPADDGTALVLYCTMHIQERAAKALQYKLNTGWQDELLLLIQPADGWLRYRVARAALRYGQHSFAARILSRLCKEAESEAAVRWLTALYRAAVTDAQLEEEGISGLEGASSGWQVCAGYAGSGAGWCAAGCAGCGACTSLSHAWMCARAKALAALARTAAAARALCTQPPPAVAQAAREPGARSGACAGALRAAARAVAAAAQRYGDIARTAFHADDATLRHLYISQHTYNQLAQFLERITSAHQEKQEPLRDFKPKNLEERIALAPSEALTDITSKLFDNPTTNPGITHRHASAVLAAVQSCCGGTTWSRGAVTARGAHAACRVSVWGARTVPDHPPPLPLSHKLAVKLEGVILPHKPICKRQKPRQVKGVQITVTATPHPRTNEKTVELTNVPPVLTAVQTVAPVRDFFSAQQLVSVPAPGLYTVAVDAAFVDDGGQLWLTGPRTSIVIKAHEEATAKGNAQATRGRF